METVEQLFHRVADAVAEADANYGTEDTAPIADQFYELMTSLRFLPNSPTLMNAGRPLGQLSACFVLPVEDSMEAIFDAVKNAALIHKSGGGTGFSFSRLRPAGSTVRSTGGVASGPVSFMRVFNMATEAVKQGGTRRGANMGILRVDHPDIEAFIRCKTDNADITNFNISVGVTEAFIRAAMDDKLFDLVDLSSGRTVKQIPAKKLFEEIVDAAWHNGEPGIIFLDRINRDNVVPSQGQIESTNPCGEQPLLPFESCNLGSINLVKMVNEGSSPASIDWSLLRETVHQAVHFLDNVIEVNSYPLAQIRDTTLATRKIGLGVMGFSDLLLMLGVPYNSDEGVALAERIMAFINDEGHRASQDLAKVRGAFPLFGESIYAGGAPLRNATVTTIAPTGSISMIAGVSSGIEPVFAYAFVRNVMDGTRLVELNPVLQRELRRRGLYSDALMQDIAHEGTVAHLRALPKELRRVFVCAHDVPPLYHARMQAAFQRHTDNAVSKTVNFPKTAAREDVAEVYLLAYKEGCKGVTIYRDGSRDGQVLNIGAEAQKASPEATTAVQPRPRPLITQGFTERIKIGCGNLYVTVNYDEHGICEVFTSTGKAGGCPSQSEATARLASVALRSGMSVSEIYDQLKGIRCPSTIRQSGMGCTSCPDAIAKVLKKVEEYIQNGSVPVPAKPIKAAKERREAPASTQPPTECPDCGEKLAHESGCVVCRSCGFSKCG